MLLARYHRINVTDAPWSRFFGRTVREAMFCQHTDCRLISSRVIQPTGNIYFWWDDFFSCTAPVLTLAPCSILVVMNIADTILVVLSVCFTLNALNLIPTHSPSQFSGSSNEALYLVYFVDPCDRLPLYSSLQIVELTRSSTGSARY